tara:strand:- start:64 stop:243 length:180 start_codon:yes stop_codon:yes gene_type:complete
MFFSLEMEDIMEFKSSNVREENGKWYFWDETGMYKYGPFDSEAEANKELRKYAEAYLNM